MRFAILNEPRENPLRQRAAETYKDNNRELFSHRLIDPYPASLVIVTGGSPRQNCRV